MVTDEQRVQFSGVGAGWDHAPGPSHIRIVEEKNGNLTSAEKAKLDPKADRILKD